MRIRKDTVILERCFIPRGAIVIKEGEYGAQAFLIQSGEVRVFAGEGETETELAKLAVGEIFGEMALIFDGPRTASVQATQDCNLIIITRQQFEDKLQATDPTINAVVNMLARRILDVNNTLIHKEDDLDGLKKTLRSAYQNIALSLDKTHVAKFQNTVLPKLDSLIETIDAFKDQVEKK